MMAMCREWLLTRLPAIMVSDLIWLWLRAAAVSAASMWPAKGAASKGVKGSQRALEGPKGSKEAMGAALEGSKGSMGAALEGSNGSQGAKGAAAEGTQGSQGAKGATSKGAEGFQGARGRASEGGPWLVVSCRGWG